MTDLRCDVAIVGGGTAGLAAERTARAHGARTLLIDDRFAGTTCADVGCMPSKLLIAAADAAHAVRKAHVFGVEVPAPNIDGVAVMERVRRLRDAFVADAKASISTLPVDVPVQARARFLDATTLVLEDGRKVFAKTIVVATGSTPAVPQPFAAVEDRILTNENVFELRDLPRTLAVVGAGPIGIEIGQAMARLGVETTIFSEDEKLAGIEDAEVNGALRAIVAGELPLVLGVKLEARPEGEGVRLSWKGQSKVFEKVLLATGRPPNLKGLALEKAGLDLDDHGTPQFDRHTLRCGSSNVFLAGDANHDRTVLHEASAEGTIAGRNAATYPDVAPGERAVRFAIVFSDPPVAILGEPPGDRTVTGRADFGNQGRARVFARTGGLANLYADRATGRLVGATLAAPGAEHYAHLLAWAIQKGATASALLDFPFYHPTYEEGLKPALRSICAQVKAPPARDRDNGFMPGF